MTEALDRIATALERIADNLDSKTKPVVVNVSGKLKPADIETIRSAMKKHPGLTLA